MWTFRFVPLFLCYYCRLFESGLLDNGMCLSVKVRSHFCVYVIWYIYLQLRLLASMGVFANVSLSLSLPLSLSLWGHTQQGILVSIKSHKGRHILFVFQQVFSVPVCCQSSQSSQDQSCGNRSVFTLSCSLVWLSTITTTEDVWTCWLPWQRGLGKGCCCVDGVHRKIEGPTGSVCGIDLFSLLWWPPLQHWIS